MRNKNETAGLACQIVFEYEGWGWEHIGDMLDTYAESGERAPCSGDELYDACVLAQDLMENGWSYSDAAERLEKML